MLRKGFSALILPLVFLIIAMGTVLVAQEKPTPEKQSPMRVLLITGGHAFDVEPFFAMFDSFDDIEYTKAEMPGALDLLKPELADEYDCIVTYDMCQQKISPEQAEQFKALLRQGIGYVALHHNVGAHRDWDEYADIIGGKFLFTPCEIDGRQYEKTPWKHGETIPATIVDRNHPITQGVEDFEIEDETYGRFYVQDDVHLLLTTDHPNNNREIAWTTSYGNSPVFYLMLGHDAKSYANPAFIKLVHQGIRWAVASRPSRLKAVETIDVEPVWSGHRVGFALLTDQQRGRQYVAYYDAAKNMTVASRSLDWTEWTMQRLPTKVGWDSHNYITMALDRDGQLHVAGNMHCVPLIYFRTTKAGDVTSLVKVDAMVGDLEQRCTYPRFTTDAEGNMVFTYRDGSSGNGNQIWNVYDPESMSWQRLLDTPLFDGQGLMNAYFVGPVRGPDGWFHVCWVWRNTPDCATNHDPGYAKSPDLRNWYRSDGTRYELPITLATADTIDPVPAGGGIINGNTRIGYDPQGQVIVTYHKYDTDGKTQVYNARAESEGWKIYQASDWGYRWEFSGGGSINFEVSLSGVTLRPGGSLVQTFSNRQDGRTYCVLDPETLQPIEKAFALNQLPHLPHLPREQPLPLRVAHDMNSEDSSGEQYVMYWQARDANRDRAFEGEIPAPSMLRVVKLRP